MAVTALKPIVKDGRGLLGFARPGYVLNRSVAASTAENIAIPSGAQYVNFVANVDFFANFTTTATVPGDVTDGSASMMNPGLLSLEGATGNISVISASAGLIQAWFFK